MGEYRERRLIICFLAAYMVFFLVVISYSKPGFDYYPRPRHFSHHSEEDFVKLFVSVYGSRRFLDRICFDQKDCLGIVDEVVYYEGRKKIVRAAVSDNLYVTSAFLKLPESMRYRFSDLQNKLSKSELDTSKWQIDFDEPPNGIEKIIAKEIFAHGSIPHPNSPDVHVLSLGLGGGFVTGHLHWKFPQMRITAIEIRPSIEKMARKWFSLETDDRYRVIIGDGIKYLRESVEKGRRFDAIILDACFLDTGADFICPNEVFLDEEPIENMATLLGERGVLTVNFLPRSKALKDMAVERFHKYFRFDKETIVEGSYNYVQTFTNFDASYVS